MQQPVIQCPRCGWYIKHVKVPKKEEHQEDWPRAFEIWTKDEYITLMKLWDDGVPILQIALELGRPPNAIVKRVKDLGFPQRTEKDPAALPPESHYADQEE